MVNCGWSPSPVIDLRGEIGILKTGAVHQEMQITPSC